ncbi:MAG: BPL-N domain-containing protein [Dehalococcoidia bacterium]
MDQTEEPVAAVYAGEGAVLFSDVAYALEILGISYATVNHDEVRNGDLSRFQVMLVPGGYTQQYMPALGDKGREEIRSFIRSGGGYIGICAGAYIATGTVQVPGNQKGLDIIDIENTRKSGRGKRKIHLEEHPITEGLDKELKIYYQNGPDITPGKDVQEIARYKNGSCAAVSGHFGEGKVVIFSPHPEASISQGIEPKPETLRLLKNSIDFCRP